MLARFGRVICWALYASAVLIGLATLAFTILIVWDDLSRGVSRGFGAYASLLLYLGVSAVVALVGRAVRYVLSNE